MIEHIRKIKMHQPDQEDGIEHTISHKKIENFNMNNFTIKEKYFESYMPYSWEGGYYLVRKDKSSFYNKLHKEKQIIIFVQIVLLSLFALISYLLSLRALKPMRGAITKLDNFSKDLIHDLNTPITSMLLNIKLLDSKDECRSNKALERIKQSLLDIGELHSNLTILLEEENLVMQDENIFEIIEDIVTTYRTLYPKLHFVVEAKEIYKRVNADALKQILQNIISNAAKYNVEDGYVKIFMQKETLIIEDGGVGIKNPDQIFERSYTEHKAGHGIGLDIVKRLCDVMLIEIEVDSVLGRGTAISLHFT